MWTIADRRADRPAWRFAPTFLSRTLLGASLFAQFVAVGGVVAVVAAIIAGTVVTSVIERGVTRNAAATTALYVDSVIAPLLPDMRVSGPLEGVVRRALDETLGEGALGDRLVEMRLWSLDGEVLYAHDEMVVGKRFAVSEGLRQASSGQIVANYNRFDSLGSKSAPTEPLLEIYNPILQPWSGEVVAVIEFYEKAGELEATLASARLRSWAVVAMVTCIFFGSLSLIVLRGNNTIEHQARALNNRLAELVGMHRRLRRATQHATTLNENHLRRLGADLHDGPAQSIALAAMRLDSELVLGNATNSLRREEEIQAIRDRLNEALEEIRTICRGLVLPQIESSSFATVVERAIEEYEKRTGATVRRGIANDIDHVALPQRICAYRFVQEGLANGHHHCPDAGQTVTAEEMASRLHLRVSDDGPGFDPEAVSPQSMGIAGLRGRIESLGGTFEIDTSSAGTTLSMILDLEEAASE
jgi:signal transduction histidine kinase